MWISAQIEVCLRLLFLLNTSPSISQSRKAMNIHFTRNTHLHSINISLLSSCSYLDNILHHVQSCAFVITLAYSYGIPANGINLEQLFMLRNSHFNIYIRLSAFLSFRFGKSNL